MTVQFEVDGRQVEVPDVGASLLDVLREQVGALTAKDGCSPQGQCGCCTVLVDGAPRVSCVTPARRVAGRQVTTLAGLAPEERERWTSAFLATGASQCGFCTPGIVVRFAALHDKGVAAGDPAVARALQAHLCRCTGWRTILDAYAVADGVPVPLPGGRDLDAASRRATIEGRAAQQVGRAAVLGEAGFAADTAPDGALVALPDGVGGWVVAESLVEARALAGKVQGRRTTIEARHPVAVPEGSWDARLATTWVEPAYLETDASWCEPGGEPASPLANGGAFGAKVGSSAPAVARELADRHGRAVRVLVPREHTVAHGAKRPPLAGGARADGSGAIRVAATPGIAEAISAVAPGFSVEEVAVAGPPTSAQLRAAGWAEAVALLAGARGRLDPVTSPDGAVAEAEVAPDGTIGVRVSCGDPLDEVVLRSYCVGAAHMALSWVTSESLAVDDAGSVHDLTIRSFGVLRAVDTPPIEVEVDSTGGPPVNGSDAVFAAVAAATWLHQGCPPAWPTGIPARG